MKIRQFDIITGQPCPKYHSPKPLSSFLPQRHKTSPSSPPLTQPQVQSTSMFNISAYNFNIINHNKSNVKKSINLSFRKKGQISSLNTKCRMFSANINSHYMQRIKNNSRAFHKQQQVCTKFCDQAKTYGPHIKPFYKFRHLN